MMDGNIINYIVIFYEFQMMTVDYHIKCILKGNGESCKGVGERMVVDG